MSEVWIDKALFAACVVFIFACGLNAGAAMKEAHWVGKLTGKNEKAEEARKMRVEKAKNDSLFFFWLAVINFITISMMIKEAFQ